MAIFQPTRPAINSIPTADHPFSWAAMKAACFRVLQCRDTTMPCRCHVAMGIGTLPKTSPLTGPELIRIPRPDRTTKPMPPAPRERLAPERQRISRRSPEVSRSEVSGRLSFSLPSAEVSRAKVPKSPSAERERPVQKVHRPMHMRTMSPSAMRHPSPVSDAPRAAAGCRPASLFADSAVLGGP